MPAARPIAAVIACLALTAIACAPSSPPAGGSPGSPGAHSYTVHGIVVRLPAPGTSRPEILIRHAAIPDFVDSQGHETGMPGMTMPFPLADGVPLEGLTPGRPVEFTLRVDWQASPSMQLTAIRVLPSPPPEGT